ncbi:MAG: class I SAM-dependent RNA methyltransferase [Myxococcales bacterium]|nr:class I SAM-dependent RNA methyltransferase [Myxococcales bacterium]
MNETPSSKADPPQPSPDLVVEIERIAYGGDGIGNLPDGKVVFVPGTLPGDRARLDITLDRKRFCRAEVLGFESESHLRQPADCEHETRDGCGGCGFRHVSDEHALAIKANSAVQACQRIAPQFEWPEPVLHPVDPLDTSRHRVHFHVQDGRLGLFKRGTRELVEVPECKLAAPEVLQAAAAIQPLIDIGASPGSAPERVLIETNSQGAFVTWKGPLSNGQIEAITSLLADNSIAGFAQRQGRDFSEWGEPWMIGQADFGSRRLTFKRRIGTFGQATPQANRLIQDRLVALVESEGPTTLIDLYAGSGNLTLPCALPGIQVSAVEIDDRALDGLRTSTQESGIDSLVTIERNLEEGCEDILEGGYDLVILDPPRSGAREIARAIGNSKPPVVAYVSCSPPHLARDLKEIGEEYVIESCDAFDMFPRTPQVELLVVLRRR